MLSKHKEVLLKAAQLAITESWSRRTRERVGGGTGRPALRPPQSPPLPMLHPSPCPPIGQLWSAGKSLASDWWRKEWGILENFARVAPVLREVVELGTDLAQQCVGLQCNAVYSRIAVQCSAMQCIAVQCSAMQCNAVQCSV